MQKEVDMKGFSTNIETATAANTNFRTVLYTGKYTQLVLMCLKPGEEIGLEVHADTDQFFRFESDTCTCTIDGNNYHVKGGDVLIVPAGAKHNIVNTSTSESAKLYTLYSPPHHKDGITRATKAEAQKSSPEFDGKTTE